VRSSAAILLHEKVYSKRLGSFSCDRQKDRKTIKVLRTSLLGELTFPCSEV